MLSPFQVFIIFTLALLAMLWFANQRAREQANAVAKRLCEQHGLQFLDGTVAMESLGLVRSSHIFSLRRSFRFEYALNRTERYRGAIIVIGESIQAVEIDAGHMRPGTDIQS